MTILYLDTETVASTRPDVVARIAAKHFDASDLEGSAAKAAEALEKTALDPLFGELVCVSLAVDEGEPWTVVRDMRDPSGERALLQSFAQELRDIQGDVPRGEGLQIVAHNAPFDRGFLRERSLIKAVDMPRIVSATGLKPWESSWICTMQLFRDDPRGRVSLDDLCFALGLPGKDGVDGSKVGELVRAGRLADVAAYCAGDVRRVRSCHLRMRGVR